VFLRHVIGGKRLSRGPRFASLVRAATPDAVLAAVELLADVTGAGVLVVDVGGATTDVYSVLVPEGAPQHPAGTLWRSRTVEGDLGVRWSAPGVVAAARAEKLVDDAEAETLVAAAETRAARPDTADTDGLDLRLTRLAATVALRRHARGEPGAARRTGRDLSRVRLLIGSGGVLRHAPAADADAALAALLTDHAGGWRVPRAAGSRVDRAYVLAAIGLIAGDFPAAAMALARRELYGLSHE
jgi:uncharacterized protein (TIGR01319 family)